MSNIYKEISANSNYPQPNRKMKANVSDVEISDSTKSTGIRRDRIGVVLCILCCELCERLTYYSIGGNLVLYCTNELKYTSADATTVAFIFTGTTYFVPVFGGWIADSVSGKFNAIFGAALIYCIGTTILPVISIDYTQFGQTLGLTVGQKQGFFICGLTLIAIGTGGIKSNVGPFGAQQLDDLGEGAVKSFFNWFYWFINVGSAIAFSGVAYVQQEIGFDVGFAIPAVSIILAIVVLMIGRKWYRMRPPEGSVFNTVAKIIFQGLSQIRKPKPAGVTSYSWLDRAKTSYGGHFSDVKVEEVKSLGRLIPIFLVLIFYWTVYFQMNTTYLLQGERMRLTYNDFTIPVAGLNLFNTLIILILVPFVDRYLYQYLARKGYPLSQLKRIGVGMVLAVVSMIVAASIEFARKADIQKNGYIQQEVGGKTFNASDLSVFAQIPQYTFIGASEVFASITSLEFAYSQAPVSMQGVIMGFCLLASGLGSYLGSLLVTVVNAITFGAEWIPNEINNGHLEYFFLLLAGIMFLNFLVFLLIAKQYRYVEDRPLDLQPELPPDDLFNQNGQRSREPGRDSVGETTALLSDSEM
ncbi:solute carrier family 15 member 4-like [Asterias amurensis]|uniref:solute carrier family 15 member 4-like n=1 Tax=Asterias amurensis TaxID=7602 RepID=UPI003AB3BAA1